MPTTINTIKFVDLYLCLFDPSNIEKCGITLEEWEEIRREWEDQNPVQSQELEIQKAVFADTVTLQKLEYLKLRLEINPNRELVFKDADMRMMTDEEIDKQMAKLNGRIEIHRAQLKKLAPEDIETPKADLSFLYKTIASLEQYATIPDYNQLTYSKYKALTEFLEEKKSKDVR